MTDLSIPILVLGVGMLLVMVVLALLLVLVGRQYLLSRQRGVFECSLQRRGLLGPEEWQHGLMRFGTDRLRWFRAFSLRWRPEVVVHRREILEVTRELLPSRLGDGQDQYLLSFTLREGREIRAIVELASGAALNSWIEAAPTGMVMGDAD